MSKGRGFEIPKDVNLFMKFDKKRYKKKYASGYESKKERKKGYYDVLFDQLLPEVIKLLVNYSHIREVQEIKAELYDKLFDKKLIKKLTEICEEDLDIDNIELFPIVIYDVLREAHKRYLAEKAEDPDAKEYDCSDLVRLSNIILKKKMKKLTKEGIKKEIAFDVLSIIPTTDVIRKGNAEYKFRAFMQVLYTHAKTTPDIDFKNIVKIVIGKQNYPALIAYLLLEKKSDFVAMDDNQKDFYNNKVTNWAFDTLEHFDDMAAIEQTIRAYFIERKKAKAQEKDCNRRFFLGSLPDDENTGYPRTVKVIRKLVDNNKEFEEFI